MSKLISSIIGEIPFDLVISNVKYVNLYTKETYTVQIGITDGKVGHVQIDSSEKLTGLNEYDAKGKYAIPGLIDTHIHTESTMMTTLNLSNTIVPMGTTTIACDPHEIGNVLGVQGVEYIINSSKNLPLDIKVLVPSSIPSVEDLETAGAVFNSETIQKLLDNDACIGLGEVMDFEGVINRSDRMNKILDVARKNNVFIQGHAPSLKGRKLSAYLSSGVESDHETSFEDEAIEKLRSGMVLECRESSIVNDIPTLLPIIKKYNYPENTTLCTDDREPDDLLNEGHIDYVIRKAIEHGGDPIEIIKIATLNASKLLRLNDRGVLTPGRRADICLIKDLNEFEVDEVFVEGDLIAKSGQMINEFKSELEFEVESLNTVKLDIFNSSDDFKIKVEGKTATVNVICFHPDKHIVTELGVEELPIKDGFIDISNRDDLATLAVYERHGVNGNHQVAFVKDFGIHSGAVASTVSHDSHNLVVIGKDYKDIRKAANLAVTNGGGIFCVQEGEILGGIELPIAGLMSRKSVIDLAKDTKRLKEAIISLGINTVSPIIQVAAFALPVIPYIRLTDIGLVDVIKQEIIPTIKNIRK